jgi:D-lactate dehydrogenase
LDVYENEKKIFFRNLIDKNIENEMYTILRSLPNVLITGHQGFLTNEALQELQAQLLQI